MRSSAGFAALNNCRSRVQSGPPFPTGFIGSGGCLGTQPSPQFGMFGSEAKRREVGPEAAEKGCCELQLVGPCQSRHDLLAPGAGSGKQDKRIHPARNAPAPLDEVVPGRRREWHLLQE